MGLTPHLLEEVAKARAQDTRKHDAAQANKLLARLFAQQYDFVTDPARNKAALCPRRAGKSYAVLLYALIVCLKRQGANVLVIGVTRSNVKGVYWGLLKQLCREFELKAHFQNTELVCTVNDSRITFSSADCSADIERFRGQGYDLVAIDECKSYSAALLEELISEVIEPAVSDRLGTIVLIGTPGAVLAGPFWEITDQKLKTVRPWADRKKWGRKNYHWSFHKWSSKDNDRCPWIWEDALRIREANQWDEDHPAWVREYLGRWIPDDDALVYAYGTLQDNRCDFIPDPRSDNEHGLPAGHDWRYLLGVDFGWTDECGFVVAAWSETHPCLHFIHAEKYSHLAISQIADRCRQLEKRFKSFDVRVADTGGLGKTIVESLSRDFGIYLEAARKQDKHDHIRLMNSDLLSGRVKVDPKSCLAEEWRLLQWTHKDDRKREDPGCANHAADAALYTWRHAHHHLSRDQVFGPEPGTTEWWKQREKQEEEKFRQELLEARQKPWWSRYRDLLDKNEAPWISKLWKK